MIDQTRLAKAFDYAAEKTKQLITLAAGIVTITISFSKDVFGGLVAWTVTPLIVAWLL